MSKHAAEPLSPNEELIALLKEAFDQGLYAGRAQGKIKHFNGTTSVTCDPCERASNHVWVEFLKQKGLNQ